jgi:hypothetical protein
MRASALGVPDPESIDRPKLRLYRGDGRHQLVAGDTWCVRRASSQAWIANSIPPAAA